MKSKFKRIYLFFKSVTKNDINRGDAINPTSVQKAH